MEKANYPIAMMCRLLEVSRSAFYAWQAATKPTVRELEDDRLLGMIVDIHRASRGTYGSPRVHAELQRQGVTISLSKVERLMRAASISGVVKRKYKVTTNSKHNDRVADNLLNREFGTESPDSVWCADITFVHTSIGFIYLAVVLDVATRLVVGWSLASHMETSLVEDALRNALGARTPVDGILHHSDRGSQYTSNDYRKLLDKHGITCSMSRKGDCWDNAVMESFFGTYKQECAHRTQWKTLGQARKETASYIEAFYNRQRLHSALGYRTPAEADEDDAA